KEKCWKPLALCCWYNDHADFFYEFSEGDKETFHMAFRKLEHAYAMPQIRPRRLKVGLCQYDFEGRKVFQHRCRDKWNLFRSHKRDPEFLYEDECLAYLSVIRRVWHRDVQYYRLAAPARG